MGDISNKELLIPYGTYQDMISRTNKYINDYKKNPNIVYINSQNKNDHVSFNRLKDMETRVAKWKNDNPTETLKNVWIKKPATTVNVLTPPASTNTAPTVNIKGKNYTPKTFTDFYMLMGGYGYGYYYNDVYSLSQEIKRISEGKVLNCTDFSQFGAWVASQYKKDNKKTYETRYAHINCKSGGGHTILEIKGGEFGNNWTRIDLAAKADKNSRIYPVGDYWCRDGKIRAYNESWILVNDGKMP